LRTIFISLAALLVSLSSVLAQDVRLRYQIELLSNAKSAVPTPPGAAGTERSFLLTCEKGDWSRLNWPLFRPIDSLRELAFQARAEPDSPSTFQVRLRTQDGIEWQSSAIALTPAWQEHRLVPDSFTYFRGDDARRGDRPDFSEVMQFQIVPASAGQGMGSFRVDEIRFLPDGPSYSADDAELVEPLAPREAERQRVEDLLGRWQFELNRLARDSRQARDWLAELRLVARSDTAALRRLANHSSPWHRTLPPVEKSTLALSPAAFDRIVAGFGDRPAPVVDLTAPGTRPYESMLYNAPTPPAPERVVEGGRSILRQVIHFEPSQARQTVFLNVDLPESIDVRGHVLEVDVKFPAVPLNKEFPFLVRLWAMWPDGRDSWADFPPDVLPNGEWQTLRFSTSAPLRSVRFQPDAIRRISFRLENQPGTGGRFPLEVGQARLGWPPAEEIARDELLNRKLDAVHDARRELYALRDQIAAAEDELSPALRRRYLSSFAPVSAPNTVAVRVMDEAQRAAAALAERRFEWGYQPDPTGVALHASLVNGQASERLLVEFYDGKTLVASATGAGSETVAIPVPPAQCWSNRRPRVCTLELAAISGGKVVARSTHSVQPGVVTVGPSPASPVLRQLRQRRQPDWSLRENGRAWFPRMACYNWISLERTVREGHRLLDDLWVDGLRRYGMSTQPGTWDAQDELGVPFLHSLAPNYRSLTGWQDVPMFRSHYSTVYGLLADNANRPFQAVVQSGNEVELSIWGATLPDAFPGALYQPLDMGTELLQDLYARRSPVMYVRAGSFRSVPPLPHEDISGINQYTGRYSGRQDEVARNLAELAREAAFYDRPLMITEWMGPKYSWATGGIGGVTRRGAAYYLERYWRAMLQTPGIAGSSEFTMNWVVAPFEDLTTQTREEAYKNRPKHSKFGGGHTADHVPLVGVDGDRGVSQGTACRYADCRESAAAGQERAGERTGRHGRSGWPGSRAFPASPGRQDCGQAAHR
jgi:hypothetical protein